MASLEKELETLEEDMKKNPYKRQTRAERERQAALADERAAAEAAGLLVADTSLPTPEEVENLGFTPDDVAAFAAEAAAANRLASTYDDLDQEEVQVVTAVL